MAEAVYLLCILTSIAATFLLLRAYARSRVRLLLWSAFAFIGLAINNILLYLDIVVLPTQVDLSTIRLVPVVVGLALLCYGLIWESA